MKIIHLISGGDVGGAKTHVHSLLQGLGKTETVQMVCFMEGVFAEEARQLGIPTKVIKSRSLRADYRALVEFIQEGGYEIVHCHGSRANMMGALLRRRLHLPVVTTVHSDYRLDYLGRPLSRLTYGTINTVALRFLDYRIGVSDGMVRQLISRGFDPKRLFSIYNGVDFSDLTAPLTREEFFRSIGLKMEPDTVVFGIAARISPVKDMTTLINAFAEAVKQCPNIRLVIAGDGEQAEEMRALAASVCPPDTVVFAGWLSDIASFYQAIDVNVLTSLSETFPYALTEGARMQCATIASRVGGVPDLIEHGINGLLFEPQDRQTLAQHMVKMATDSAFRRRTQIALHQKTADQFSVEATVEHQKEIYRTILRLQSRKQNKKDGVLICGAYGRGNAGDDMILQAIINQLRHVDPDLPIDVLSRKPKQTRMRYRVGACHIFNPFAFLQVMRRTKLYISGGGTLMQNATSNRSLHYYLTSIRLAHSAGNRVMLYGCGIGPITGRLNCRRTARVLNSCADMITLRDDKCAAFLQELGVTKPEIHITADPALLFDPAEENTDPDAFAELGLDPEKQYAMFVLRPWYGYNLRVESLAQAAQNLYHKHGCIPVFLALEPERDLKAIEKVTQLLDCPYLTISPLDRDDKMIRLFSRMSIVVAMRLHALVFAAGQGVPLLGIVYDPKVDGFLEYLGQKNYIPLQDVTAERLETEIERTMTTGVPTAASVARLRSLAAENGHYVRKVLEESI